jgi:O-antigen/teichoic acid export membrane protein
MKKEANWLAKVALILGSAQVIKMGAGVLRGKAIAVLFGPTGIALWGLYQSFIDMIQSFALLGLEKGGVQDLSKSNDIKEISYKALVLFGLVLFLVFIILFAINLVALIVPENYKFITSWMFEISIAFAALNIVSMVILNSLQEYKKLALTQTIGVIFGNSLAVSLLYYYGVDSLSLAFLTLNLSLFLFTFYSVFSVLEKNVTRIVPIRSVVTKFISLGLPFWFPQVLTASGLLLINILIESYAGLEVLGLYVAGWAIANLFANILFSTLSGGYFPTLCKRITKNQDVVDLVNWQIEFGILLFSVGGFVIFLFPEVFISIFYTNELYGAAQIIQWLIIGSMLRMIGFPMGYALMGYEKGALYIISQVIFNIFNVAIVLLIFNAGFETHLGGNYLFSYLIYVALLWYFVFFILKLKLSVFSLWFFLTWLFALYFCLVIDSIVFSLFMSGILVVVVTWLMNKRLNINIISLFWNRVTK